MNLEEFLYQVADRLRRGDYLDPDVILPVLDESREYLEERAAEVEANPSPAGLEALDDATLEAYNLFAEALDLLELAVEEPEGLLAKISMHRPVPKLFRTSWFSWIVFAVMMGFMTTRLIMAWGDVNAVGGVFRTMWIVSMTLAIGLGIYFKSRVWCTICPMGLMQGVASTSTYLLTVDDTCIECKKCQKVCPIGTYPGSYRKESGFGQVPSVECLRCFNCITNCPKKSLSFR